MIVPYLMMIPSFLVYHRRVVIVVTYCLLDSLDCRSIGPPRVFIHVRFRLSLRPLGTLTNVVMKDAYIYILSDLTHLRGSAIR